uniref:CCHC-type domain-containing protein n=1 Tax=Neogobius melanostomus TaxID=47308 RepID=A0A8C6TMF7_9GOBI
MVPISQSYGPKHYISCLDSTLLSCVGEEPRDSSCRTRSLCLGILVNWPGGQLGSKYYCIHSHKVHFAIMEVFDDLGIKIPNAVLVDGAVEPALRDDVIDFLTQYGDINRNVVVEKPDTEFNDRVVVEFISGSALVKLSPLLPYTYTSDAGHKCCIENLSNIYTSKFCGSKSRTLMAELKDIAKLSGKQYAEILQEMMEQVSYSAPQVQVPIALSATANKEDTSPSSQVTTTVKQSDSPFSGHSPSGSTTSAGTQGNADGRERRSTIYMAPSDLNPPEVQRYLVEHVVRSGDGSVQYHSSHRLRTFSGKMPRPAHETDYDTWQSGVELILKDPSISDLQRTRLIRDNLLPPAAEIVKHLSPDTAPETYLQHLNSAYGTVQDGDELYAKFLDTYQDAGEKPSTYLQRLQVALQIAVKRGGIPVKDVDKRLLIQFTRGCWDNNLIVELQLRQKKHNPPSFAELLLLLRTEEDQDAAKAVRMKQHLGVAKQRVASHAQLVHPEEETNLCAALTNLTKQFTEQMSAMQNQLAALTASQSGSSPRAATKTFEKPKFGNVKSAFPKPGFCFCCGEDGHIKPQCENPPNPSLVSSKRKQFNSKQQKFQKPSTSGHLN